MNSGKLTGESSLSRRRVLSLVACVFMLEWLELVLLASGPRNAFQVLPLRSAMLQELFIQGAMSSAERSLAGSRLTHAVVHHLTEAEA